MATALAVWPGELMALCRDVSEPRYARRLSVLHREDLGDEEDDARLNNYLRIATGRRNALPPPPGDLMALLQKM
jgi:hypothetical protein